MKENSKTIIEFARNYNIHIGEIHPPNLLAFTDRLKENGLVLDDEGPGKGGSNICQSDFIIELIVYCINHRNAKVRVWVAYNEESQLLGLMLMAPTFKSSFRAEITFVSDFLPQHKNFRDAKTKTHISDMITLCAKGNQGVGKLLTLMALSECKEDGLFLQVQEIYEEVAVGVELRKSIRSEAAKAIFRKYNFEPLEVQNSENDILNVLAYYRDHPIEKQELTTALDQWETTYSRNHPKIDAEINLAQNHETASSDYFPEYLEHEQLDYQFGQEDNLQLFGLENQLSSLQLQHLDASAGPSVIQDQTEEVRPFPALAPISNFVINPDSFNIAPAPAPFGLHPPRQHLRPGPIPEPKICPVCGKQFTRFDNLRRHEKAHEEIQLAQREWECPTCHKRYHRKRDLETHIVRIHQKLKRYQCPHCPHKSATNSDVRDHIANMHKESSFRRQRRG